MTHVVVGGLRAPGKQSDEEALPARLAVRLMKMITIPAKIVNEAKCEGVPVTRKRGKDFSTGIKDLSSDYYNRLLT